MIDRGRLHDRLGEQQGLDALEGMLLEVRGELAGMVTAARRLDARLRLLIGAIGRPTAGAIAGDWLEVQSTWQATARRRAAQALDRIRLQRAILERSPPARPRRHRSRKLQARRRSLFARADLCAAELAAIVALVDRSRLELAAGLMAVGVRDIMPDT